MQNSKTFSFFHFPSFRKNCVFCINILGLDVNHRPFLSLSLFISFSPFFSPLRFVVSKQPYTETCTASQKNPPTKTVHLRYKPSIELARGPRGEEQEDLSPSLSLPLSPRFRV